MVQEKLAVVLAAGFGKRMGTGRPKQLVPVFGIPLIEHVLRPLLSRGYRVVVVYHSEELARFIRERFPEVELVKNPHPERENGYSLYLASEVVDGEFLLVMSDHYYSSEFFDLAEKGASGNVAVVSSYCHDPDEATKVRVEGDRVVAISKGLEDYHYFDTGMFVCTPEVFNYAEELVSEKEQVRLADVFQRMADDRRLGYLVCEGRWIDVDAPWEVGIAEDIIKESIVKSEDGLVSRRINRPISLRITRWLLGKEWATPNRLTLFSFVMGLFSALLFALRCPFWGGLWAQLTSIVDGCDGEIARIKHMRSRFGAVLDSTTDRYADMFIVLGIFSSLPLSWASVLGLFLASTGVIIFSYVWHLTKVRVRAGGRDVRLFLVMLGGVLGSLNSLFLLLTLWVVGLLAHVCAFLSLWGLFKEHKGS